MYQGFNDPYCYAGTAVLINRAGIRDPARLTEFELLLTSNRFEQPLPNGRFGFTHYCSIHRHLFQDVYEWAGKIRTVRIAKDGSMFCYPEHIKAELDRIFLELKKRNFLKELSGEAFAGEAAQFMADLNAVHAFRDGNGRTQLAFLSLLAFKAGFEFRHEEIDAIRFLSAMIASFHGKLDELAQQIQGLIKINPSLRK